jgi:signal transduction histidine kinase
MNKLIFAIFCFAFFYFSSAQNNELDSLKNLVKNAKVDSTKVNLLNQLTEKFIQLGDSQNAISFSDQSILFAKKINYVNGIIEAYRIKTDFYHNSSQNLKTIDYATKGLQLSKQAGNKRAEFKNLMSLSNAFFDLGNYKIAMDYGLTSLTLAKKMKSPDIYLTSAYNLIASIYLSQDNSFKALNYFKKALSLTKKLIKLDSTSKLVANTSLIYSNIGIIYSNKQQYDSAMLYFNLAEKYARIADNRNLSTIYTNIGVVYFGQKNYDEALRYFYLVSKNEINFPELKVRANSYLNIGNTYFNLNKLALAEKNLLLSLKLCEENSLKPILVECYKLLGDLYKKKHRFEKAFYYNEKYIELNNELFNEAKLKEINKNVFNYEIELKEKEIQILQAEKKQKELELQASKSKRILVYFILTVCFAIIIIVMAYSNAVKQKNKTQNFNYILLHSQEEERKRIANELHDGIGHNLLAIKHQKSDDLIDITIQELRNISRNLHPIQLEKLGLKAALESIITDVSGISGIYFTMEIENINNVLKPQVQIHIFRIVQECISNIIKHSKATAARLIIKKTKQNLNITIFDNGIGFNTSTNKNTKSLGFSSITERVGLIGGKLYIKSKVGETKIEIKIRNV